MSERNKWLTGSFDVGLKSGLMLDRLGGKGILPTKINSDAKLLKLLIIGDGSVGKTCLRNKYVLPVDHGGSSPEAYKGTAPYADWKTLKSESELYDLGVYQPSHRPELSVKLLTVDRGSGDDDKYQMVVQVYELPGLETYRCNNKFFFSECDAVMFVCNINDPKTLANVVDWRADLYAAQGISSKEKFPSICVASKQDINTPLKLTDDQLTNWRKSTGIQYFKLSSWESDSFRTIDDAFTYLISTVLELEDERKRAKEKIDRENERKMQELEMEKAYANRKAGKKK